MTNWMASRFDAPKQPVVTGRNWPTRAYLPRLTVMSESYCIAALRILLCLSAAGNPFLPVDHVNSLPQSSHKVYPLFFSKFFLLCQIKDERHQLLDGGLLRTSGVVWNHGSGPPVSVSALRDFHHQAFHQRIFLGVGSI